MLSLINVYFEHIEPDAYQNADAYHLWCMIDRHDGLSKTSRFCFFLGGAIVQSKLCLYIRVCKCVLRLKIKLTCSLWLILQLGQQEACQYLLVKQKKFAIERTQLVLIDKKKMWRWRVCMRLCHTFLLMMNDTSASACVWQVCIYRTRPGIPFPRIKKMKTSSSPHFLPVRPFARPYQFEMWAAVVPGSPIAKPLLVVNWPVCTANIVIDYPIRQAHVIPYSCPIRWAAFSACCHVNWARPMTHNCQFRWVSILSYFYLHSNYSILSNGQWIWATFEWNSRSI